MTAAEFVAQLDEANQAVLRRLEPDATLKPEVAGALNVTNLLKVALKNEIEATEIAARWLVATRDVEVKMAFARQAGDEAKHYRMIADRLGELGFDARSFDPLAQGFGPLFLYLDSLPTTVERVAAGGMAVEDDVGQTVGVEPAGDEIDGVSHLAPVGLQRAEQELLDDRRGAGGNRIALVAAARRIRHHPARGNRPVDRGDHGPGVDVEGGGGLEHGDAGEGHLAVGVVHEDAVGERVGVGACGR